MIFYCKYFLFLRLTPPIAAEAARSAANRMIFSGSPVFGFSLSASGCTDPGPDSGTYFTIVSSYVISSVHASSAKYFPQYWQYQYSIFPSASAVASLASTFITSVCPGFSPIISSANALAWSSLSSSSRA